MRLNVQSFSVYCQLRYNGFLVRCWRDELASEADSKRLIDSVPARDEGGLSSWGIDSWYRRWRIPRFHMYEGKLSSVIDGRNAVTE